jgi:hypothetical protein
VGERERETERERERRDREREKKRDGGREGNTLKGFKRYFIFTSFSKMIITKRVHITKVIHRFLLKFCFSYQNI